MGKDSNVNSGLISIIVPLYNAEAYIDRCVISILGQSYENWELLLIDGASKDASAALCDKWSKSDKRIRFLSLDENKGVSDSRNAGLKIASGEYITFVDVDDWLLPDCLERLRKDIERFDVQIAGCGFISCTGADWAKRRLDKDGGKETPEEADVRLIKGADFLREGILSGDTRCWSKLYESAFLKGHYFREDYTIGEDMLFVWESASEAKLISVSSYAGYCYYRNENGAMLKPFSEKDIDQVRCWQFLLDSLLKENEREKKYDTDVISKTASILLISCMLVVGKLSRLPAKEREKYERVKNRCGEVIKNTLRIEGAYAKLDRGYRLKVSFYKRFPDLYIKLYHILKTR